MPELPEVECVVQSLRPSAEGRLILGFESRWTRQLNLPLPDMQARIEGAQIVGIGRRGKWILMTLQRGRESAGFLRVHLKMSGRLVILPDGQPEPSHVRAYWQLKGRTRLYFCDARKFGRVEWNALLCNWEKSQGAEPLAPEFSQARLGELIGKRARQLKPLLLDQSVVAGLGNIYTDEALYRARLHPLTRSDRLSTAEIGRLHRAIQAVLREALRCNGTSIDWVYPEGRMQDNLRVYGRTGQPCRRCRTPIHYQKVGQRGTHLCPRCQTRKGGRTSTR